MNQEKIGHFIKQLRKEKGISQEELATIFNVSNRTVSRWETGFNMPDISLLSEIAEYFEVSVDDLLQGERTNSKIEYKQSIVRIEEYSKNSLKTEISTIITIGLNLFGLIMIISGFILFPSDSSWSSIFAYCGTIVILISIFMFSRIFKLNLKYAFASIFLCLVSFSIIFSISDYLAIKYFNQIPRFRITTTYDSNYPDFLIYEKPFYKVLVKNAGTEYQEVVIMK